jgi:hypothetical protein
MRSVVRKKIYAAFVRTILNGFKLATTDGKGGKAQNNLNIHFHMLFLDGVYVDGVNGSAAQFRRVKAPTRDELTQLGYIPLLNAWPAFWSAKGCWSGMTSLAIWQRIR